MVQIYDKKSEKQANLSESVKNKIGRNSLSYTLFFYGWLSLFISSISDLRVRVANILQIRK